LKKALFNITRVQPYAAHLFKLSVKKRQRFQLVAEDPPSNRASPIKLWCARPQSAVLSFKLSISS
jgi:hypothetical protein